MKALSELISDIEAQKPSIIPLFKKTERRLLSVFMGALYLVPEYRGAFYKLLNYTSGKTCSHQCLMEPQYKTPKYPNTRPDGLVVCTRGQSVWSVFFEAKTDKPIRPTQMQEQADLAQILEVDAVVSISNEFAREPKELPYALPLSKRRKRDFFHFSWADIRTFTTLFLDENTLCNQTEIMVLEQVLHYFWQPDTGIKTYDAMPPDWPKFVESARDVRGLGFQTNTSGVTEIVHGWQQERRDLSAKLMAKTKLKLRMQHEAGTRADSDQRLKFDKQQLANDYVLTATYQFLDTKTNVWVKADLSACRISTAIEFSPPAGKKARGTITWLIKKLQDNAPENLIVSIDWRGRSQAVHKPLAILNDEIDQVCEGQKEAPKTIRLIQEFHDVRQFKSRSKFIEQLEKLTLQQVALACDTKLI